MIKKRDLESLIRAAKYDEVINILRHDSGAARLLMSLLYTDDELLFWRTVKTFGIVSRELPNIAKRFIIRLLWQLNDESGSIGRGSAQSLGEMAANNLPIVRDSARVACHYLDDYGLLPGVLYCIGRTGAVAPDLTNDITAELTEFLRDPSPAVRGMAAWAVGQIGATPLRESLNPLMSDADALTIYDPDADEIKTVTVKQLANDAVEKLAARGGKK